MPDPDQMRLGAVLLGLIGDWDAWISRRVDRFYFAGDDERVLHRHQSLDYQMPDPLKALEGDLLPRYGGFPLPITFANKWRIPEFSLRDGSDKTVSLLQREEAAPLAAAMLMALATYVRSSEQSLRAKPGIASPLPAGLREELAEIASGEPAGSLRRCVDFQRIVKPGPERPWREQLAESELFMSLAYELAVGFPLMALVSGGGLERQVLKFSYNSYLVPAERDRWPVRFGHGVRWVANRTRDAIDPIEWGKASSARSRRAVPPRPEKTASLTLVTSCDWDRERLQHGALSIACGIATVEGLGGKQTVRIRPSGIVTINGIPPGTYTISIDGRSGYWTDPTRCRYKLSAGEVTRVPLRVRRISFETRETLAAPAIVTPPWGPKKFSRGIGWSSKPLVIRVRLGVGGSYHCHFDAPDGLHLTRAKLVSNLTGNIGDEGSFEPDRYVDTVLRNGQQAHVYGPAHRAQPATGYVFLNLRPRVETIVRPALFTAIFTTIVLAVLAAIWNSTEIPQEEDGPPWAILAVLLGGPSALAAYFAQAVPSRVTNALLYGIRLSALLPVVISLLAAAALLAYDERAGGALWGVVGLSFVPIFLLGLTYRFAEHPLEQRPENRRQGPEFEDTHLDPERLLSSQPAPRAEVPLPPEKARARVRDRMMERLGGMTAATRRRLLWQRSYIFWDREVPPELYFESGEAAAVFLGVHRETHRGRLRKAVTDYLKNSPPSSVPSSDPTTGRNR